MGTVGTWSKDGAGRSPFFSQMGNLVPDPPVVVGHGKHM